LTHPTQELFEEDLGAVNMLVGGAGGEEVEDQEEGGNAQLAPLADEDEVRRGKGVARVGW
jgi:predicted ABC-class ATPase